MRVGSLRLEADAYLSPGVYMPGDFFAHGVHHPCISYTGLLESARFRCGVNHGKFPGERATARQQLDTHQTSLVGVQPFTG